MGKGDAGDNTELIELSTSRLGYWAKTENRGNIRDVQIENVKVLKSDRSVNTIRIEGASENSTVEKIRLNNINVCGEELSVLSKDSESLRLVTNKFTKKISINSIKYNLINRAIAWLMKMINNFIKFFN